ncbi:hypothetical protein FJZ33_04400 [Candidatus Poribacteria bacterium]|nr:hypothetical protein [Candidatus Poribacteria bacterium]
MIIHINHCYNWINIYFQKSAVLLKPCYDLIRFTDTIEAIIDFAAFQEFQSQFPFLFVFGFLNRLSKASRAHSFRSFGGDRKGKIHKATVVFSPLVKSYNGMTQAS